jgi:anaerobic selenocysteine-containing dehydrogenase
MKDGQELCEICGRDRRCVICRTDTSDDYQAEYIDGKYYCVFHIPEEEKESVIEVIGECPHCEMRIHSVDTWKEDESGTKFHVPCYREVQKVTEKNTVHILNEKPEKTKTGRILQIMQEDRKETHPISDKCYNCRHFNENGSSYQDRCQAEYMSFHSFKRYDIDGQEFYTCEGFSPKEEYIDDRKSKITMDMKVAMFEMLLYSEHMYTHNEPDLSWLKKYYKPFRNISPLSPKLIVDYFEKMDEATQAYLVEVVSKRYLLTKARNSGAAPLHTTEGNLKVKYKGLENAEDI